MRRKKRYNKNMPRELYLFFLNYAAEGAPSFCKFSKKAGITLEEFNAFRRHKEFERACRECAEIRRDYIIDMALMRKLDPAFSKFLLGEDLEKGELDNKIEFTLKVIE